MFSVADRDRVRDRVLEWPASDARVVAGAVVGSLALGGGDRWSDLDLTFAVADGVPVAAVLEDWGQRVVAEFNAVHLFDLPSGPSIYRVFMLPGCLQFDLSFTPASQFGATSPRFKLLFGRAVDRQHIQQPSAHELFGYAVHHALRARFCIERGRLWQAQYWIDSLREHALSLACRRRGLPARYGRGFDDLPAEVRALFNTTLVPAVEKGSLLRALAAGIARLLEESEQVAALAAKAEPHLRELAAKG
jgi:hypothetical protein